MCVDERVTQKRLGVRGVLDRAGLDILLDEAVGY